MKALQWELNHPPKQSWVEVDWVFKGHLETVKPLLNR